MAKQTINIGSSVNKGDGDPLRTAFDKINDNFDELYAADVVSALTDLSVTTAAAGTAALSYNDTTGVFTYTPPDLSSYLTSVPAQTFASLTGKPTTVAGYGITDALTAGSAFDVQGSVFGDNSTLLVDGVNGVIPSNIVVADRWTKQTTQAYQASHGERIFIPEGFGGAGSDTIGPDNPQLGDWFQVVSFDGDKQVYPDGLDGSFVTVGLTPKYFIYDGSGWKATS